MRTLFTIVALALSFSVMAQIPNTGLIGSWIFSGNANDVTGNGNNGIVNGATLTFDRFGNPNSAYHFNGTSDFIQMPNGGPTGNSPRTVSFWARTNHTGEMVPFDYGNANGNDGAFQTQFNNGCQGFGLDASGGVITKGNASFLDSTWHHFAIVLDPNIGSHLNEVLVYVDGALITPISCGALNQSVLINTGNVYPVRIGKVADGNVRYFNGDLDDFYFYDVALDSMQLQQLFGAQPCFETVYDTVTTNITVFDTTYVTITDTNYVSVTDTLLIDVATGLPSPNAESTIRVYPNPANTHITIDNGNYVALGGFTVKITNSIGQAVFQSPINQQQFVVDLSTWSGNGIYYVNIIDSGGNTVDVRKIVLQ